MIDTNVKKGLVAVGVVLVVAAGFVVPHLTLAQDPEGFVQGERPSAAEVAALHNATTHEQKILALLITGYTADVEFCNEERLDITGHSEVRTWWFLPLRRSTHSCDE